MIAPPKIDIESSLASFSKKAKGEFLINDVLNMAVSLLNGLNISSSSRLDAELLLATALRKNRLDILTSSNSFLLDEDLKIFLPLLKRRLTYEPMAYILGEKEFYTINLKVNKSCLIPRPDTETLVEAVLSIFSKNEEKIFLDIGTGSGAIALAILKERSKFFAFASDLSQDALNVALENAINNNLNNRIAFIKSDLFYNIDIKNKYDFIVSNPPYIGFSEYENLMPEVRLHEPKMALRTKDEAGLQFYKELLKESLKFLKEEGFLIMEIGYNQKHLIMKLINGAWKNIKFLTDLAQNDRVIILQKS